MQVGIEVPEYTADAIGVLRILEVVHFLDMGKTCCVYQAYTKTPFTELIHLMMKYVKTSNLCNQE